MASNTPPPKKRPPVGKPKGHPQKSRPATKPAAFPKKPQRRNMLFTHNLGARP